MSLRLLWPRQNINHVNWKLPHLPESVKGKLGLLTVFHYIRFRSKQPVCLLTYFHLFFEGKPKISISIMVLLFLFIDADHSVCKSQHLVVNVLICHESILHLVALLRGDRFLFFYGNRSLRLFESLAFLSIKEFTYTILRNRTPK